MRNIYRTVILLLSALALLSCAKEALSNRSDSGQVDMTLLGRAVNFNASYSDVFATRATYNHTGEFNENDVMTVYRQYWDDESESWGATDSRVYYYKGTYAAGTNINISRDWKVFPKRWGTNENGEFFEQQEQDSLVWDNGKTVRFRAWSRSNLAGAVSESGFYPDYTVSDWVTVSGPSQAIPLALKHVGCRIAFDVKNRGNVISSVELCTRLEDYIRDDNSDSYDNDAADKEDDPQAALASVLSVYNKMCMPAGVDLDNYFIRTMTNEMYDKIKSKEGFPGGFSNFEELCEKNNYQGVYSGIVHFGTMSSDYIANYVKRPGFSNLDSRSYMVTTPYDMSNESTNGDVLVLPPCTRFKVRLYDVNADQDKEHIFSLKDVGGSIASDGLSLLAGYSFKFLVGYQYDNFTVDVDEYDMIWNDGGSSEIKAQPDVPDPVQSGYKWWQDAIYTAAEEASGTSRNFNPVFTISNAAEFEEFVNLVNGTTGFKTSGLDKARRAVDNPEADPLDDKNQKRMYWYKTPVESGQDTVWVTKAEAIAEGYLFYRRYYPQISTTAAHSEEWYLDLPYSFYHEQLGVPFLVKLGADIDLKDKITKTIGLSEDKAFKGYFDGNMHKINNLDIDGDHYLFGYAEDADIRNLVVESTNPVSILNQGLANPAKSMRILGVSLKAPCSQSPIANTLAGKHGNKGRSYVIGCIYEGDSDKPMVGTADELTMYGCMNIAENVSGAALLGAGDGLAKFVPQSTSKVEWNGYFGCNYFLMEAGTNSVNARPVPGFAVSQYKPQQYIKGGRSYILKAVKDNLLGEDVKYDKLPNNQQQRAGYYGQAPYKAMNYAIEEQYNKKNDNYTLHPCAVHFEVDETVYGYTYPRLVSGRPESGRNYGKDPVTENN